MYYFVYLLKREGMDQIYIGFTSNLKRRLEEHRVRGDWKLVYFEGFKSEEDARIRERKLKQYGASLGHLKNRLSNSLRAE